MKTKFGEIFQHGYIVADIEKTAQEWAEHVGVGPFYVLEQVKLEKYYYRGKLTDLEMRLAFGYWGTIQIELIQPLSTTDTLYTRALKTEAGKMNHCAAVVTDLDALMAERNLEGRVIQSGSSGSVKFAYLDQYLPGGFHLELIQTTQEGLMGFAAMEAIARRWDGKNPIRPMAAMAQDMASLKAAE